MQAATALSWVISLHFYKSSSGKKKVVLDEGNKFQHVGPTYGGSKHQMPKGYLMAYLMPYFVCVKCREPACCMAAGISNFDITQNERCFSSFFTSFTSLLLFKSVQSKGIIFIKYSHFEIFFFRSKCLFRGYGNEGRKALSKNLSKSSWVLEVH